MSRIELNEFRMLLLAELDAVHRLAYHLTLSAHEAEDLVQETYLRALKSYATFRSTGRGARSWLFKILHNLYRSRLSRRARQAAGYDAQEKPPARDPDPVPGGIDWEQVDGRLKRAIEKLPAAQRSLIVLWAIDGMTYQQMAEVTEAPIGTVMSRLYRARQTLVQEVADLAREKGLSGASPRQQQMEPSAPEAALELPAEHTDDAGAAVSG